MYMTFLIKIGKKFKKAYPLKIKYPLIVYKSK